MSPRANRPLKAQVRRVSTAGRMHPGVKLLGGLHFELHGMALAALVGIVANALLPAALNQPELDAHPRE